jgi:hypothetical protein
MTCMSEVQVAGMTAPAWAARAVSQSLPVVRPSTPGATVEPAVEAPVQTTRTPTNPVAGLIDALVVSTAQQSRVLNAQFRPPVHPERVAASQIDVYA